MDTVLPTNHVSNFPDSWWNERRRRDYTVNDRDEVVLVAGSETEKRLVEGLRLEAARIALRQITSILA